nr:MAG TPA: hypothetical protein [Caudoviricetes sp.]
MAVLWLRHFRRYQLLHCGGKRFPSQPPGTQS